MLKLVIALFVIAKTRGVIWIASLFYTYRENSADEEDLPQKTTKQETLSKSSKAK